MASNPRELPIVRFERLRFLRGGGDVDRKGLIVHPVTGIDAIVGDTGQTHVYVPLEQPAVPKIYNPDIPQRIKWVVESPYNREQNVIRGHSFHQVEHVLGRLLDGMTLRFAPIAELYHTFDCLDEKVDQPKTELARLGRRMDPYIMLTGIINLGIGLYDGEVTHKKFREDMRDFLMYIQQAHRS